MRLQRLTESVWLHRWRVQSIDTRHMTRPCVLIQLWLTHRTPFANSKISRRKLFGLELRSIVLTVYGLFSQIQALSRRVSGGLPPEPETLTLALLGLWRGQF